jgi:hypothetical protein
MAVASGGTAVALGISPVVALPGGALAAAVIALAPGRGRAAIVAAVIAPLLAVASWSDAGTGELVRGALGLAAAGWAIAELASAARSPLVALVPACAAGVIDPRFAALFAIAGWRLAASIERPRWWPAVPVVGAALIALAVLAGCAWSGLGNAWFGAAHPVAPLALAVRAVDALGPVTAVAALAGLATLRARWSGLAAVAAALGCALADLRAGGPSAATIGLAALLAALAIERLAVLIRVPSGQSVAGALAGALVVAPPAWSAVERAQVAHFGRASR